MRQAGQKEQSNLWAWLLVLKRNPALKLPSDDIWQMSEAGSQVRVVALTGRRRWHIGGNYVVDDDDDSGTTDRRRRNMKPRRRAATPGESTSERKQGGPELIRHDEPSTRCATKRAVELVNAGYHGQRTPTYGHLPAHLNPVYTIQPVVKAVVQPVWQSAVHTIQPFVKPVVNGFDNRLYRVNGALRATRLSDPDEDSKWISVQIHLANRMTMT